MLLRFLRNPFFFFLFVAISSYANDFEVSDVTAVPNAPSNLAAEEVSFDFVFLTWDDNSEDEDRFLIDRAGADSVFSLKYTVNKDEEDFFDFDVSLSTLYYYRIKAENADGVSEYSNVIEVTTTDLPNNVPDAPSNLVLDKITASGLQFSWTSNSGNHDGFIVYRSENGGEFEVRDSLRRSLSSFTEDSLKGGFNYAYYLKAYNRYGNSSESDTLVAVIPLRIDARIASVSARKIVLSWSKIDVVGDMILIERSDTDPDDLSVIGNTSTADTVYIDLEVTPNTKYYYRVLFLKSGAVFGASDILNASTISGEITGRVKEGLLAEYHFEKTEGSYMSDVSGVEPALDLEIDQLSIGWNDKNKLQVIEPTSLRSSDDAEKITSAFNSSKQISLELWIKTDSISQDTSCVMGIGNEETNFFKLLLIPEYAAGQLNYSYLLCIEDGQSLTGEFPVPSDYRWRNSVLHHLVFTRDSLGTILFTINNDVVLNVKSDALQNPIDTDQIVYFGNNYQYNQLWSGTFYLAAFYNKSLGQEEISQNYFAGPDIDSVAYTEEVKYAIQIFPNITSGVVNMSVIPIGGGYEFTEQAALQITNPSGLLIKEVTILDSGSQVNYSLDFSGFSTGTYHVNLVRQGVSLQMERFILVK